MTITPTSTSAGKAIAKPTSDKKGQDRFYRILFVVGMIVFTAYRHDPEVHHAMQPHLHALLPFLF